MIGFLSKLEAVIESAFEGIPLLRSSGVEPLDLVRQVEREIERNRRHFVNDQTYVAHRILVHLYSPTWALMEEYEALFHHPDFRKYIEEFIADRGYKLLDRIRIQVRCHAEKLPEFGRGNCFVEFSWPQPASDPGEVTVVLDPIRLDRILSVHAPRTEVTREAWLEVLEGKSYDPVVPVRRSEFNIGRTEQVLHSQTGRLLCVNHLAFQRPEAGDLVNSTVSRQHARIVSRSDAFFLYDLGSQNGTFVENARRVQTAPQPAPEIEGIELSDGDTIVLGSARVRFRVGSAEGGKEQA